MDAQVVAQIWRVIVGESTKYPSRARAEDPSETQEEYDQPVGATTEEEELAEADVATLVEVEVTMVVVVVVVVVELIDEDVKTIMA